MCLRADEGLHLAPAARRTYLINCLAALQAPLAQHNCSAGRADALGQGQLPYLHSSAWSFAFTSDNGEISRCQSCFSLCTWFALECVRPLFGMNCRPGGACGGPRRRPRGGAAAPLPPARPPRPHPLLPGALDFPMPRTCVLHIFNCIAAAAWMTWLAASTPSRCTALGAHPCPRTE